MDGLIGVASRLHTDGHLSYPGVASNLSLQHKVVINSEGFKALDGTHTNNIEGFKALDGTHTNNIEGFWGGLESCMRKEHSVKRDNIDIWLEEYTFKKRYLNNLEPGEFESIYNEILKIFID
ncbi:hypothetical protein DMUE_1522 [Dictyocoela muelleri]|nr:hypothetical protein DMUE_1522 [Dictyocoela muelleri]